jgi:anhydro-N-acetylmuramic acid kinase
MESKNNFKVIGLMSGTSLDGLDLAYCHFKKRDQGWSYSLKAARTVRYAPALASKLSSAQNLQGVELVQLDYLYGHHLGRVCRDFVREHRIKVDFIASHGHTIFHQPKKGITYQLGNGNALHSASALPVVCDFRSLDVLRGGEGAPLVPVGDKLLFHAYDVCLNLGGIANLSADVRGKRVAFDICFCNMALNYLMHTVGKQYDKGGARASAGEVSEPMLGALRNVYAGLQKKRPSLGREFFEQKIVPILETKGIALNDKLRTFALSSAQEIAAAIRSTRPKATVLCSGGGAFNSFLLATLLDQCGDDITLVLPEDDVIKFKEAIVFAFLGVLRVRGEVNCLSSVTGATKNSSTGIRIGF